METPFRTRMTSWYMTSMLLILRIFSETLNNFRIHLCSPYQPSQEAHLSGNLALMSISATVWGLPLITRPTLHDRTVAMVRRGNGYQLTAVLFYARPLLHGFEAVLDSRAVQFTRLVGLSHGFNGQGHFHPALDVTDRCDFPWGHAGSASCRNPPPSSSPDSHH